MAIAGFVVGFILDILIARLAREPYERGDDDGDDAQPQEPRPRSLELASETGSMVMPSLLTTASWYRTAAVVAVTTAAFAVLGRQYAGDDAHLAITAFYASVLIICASTDILAYRVPNAVTYPAILAALGVGMVIGEHRLSVLAGGLIFGGILFVPSIITGGAMGMGDVKLALFVGFALGLALIVPAMLIMALSGGLAALLLLVTRLRSKGDPIPYAPFIAGGALLTILLHGTAFVTI
jgi:prepilin signal peptidase PulO-like enzyme (type II secretory pathway)